MSSHDIYPSLSGAAASWRHLEVVANNLANTSSTGFKEQRVAFELADRGDEPLASSMVQLDTEGADLSDGPVNQTGVRTNLALRGRGFFLAQAADGSQVMGRANWLDANNTLVTAGGEPVLGESGPVQIRSDSHSRSRRTAASIPPVTMGVRPAGPPRWPNR